MDPQKKLDFIHKMTKMALEHASAIPHFAAGGPIPGEQPLKAGGVGGAFTDQNSYQAQLAPTTDIAYAPTAATGVTQQAQGVGTVQGQIAEQQRLAKTLEDQSKGEGPNPAQAALNTNTGTNVANTAALIASGRGASANPGLAARSAATAGAGVEQQAVGQGAALQAEQSLAAQRQLQEQQALIANEGNAVATQGTNLYGTAAGANNTANANTIGNYNNAQTINAATAQNNSNAANKADAGLLGGASKLLSLGRFAKGGRVSLDHLKPETRAKMEKKYPHLAKGGMAGCYADGGDIKPTPAGKKKQEQPAPVAPAPAYGASTGRNVVVPLSSPLDGFDPSSFVGKFLKGGGAPQEMPMPAGASIAGDQGEPGSMPTETMLAARGGKVKAKSPEEQAEVSDDSLKNDKIDAELSEGEIVLPRSITMHKMAPEKAAEFVRKTLAKRKLGAR